jgi:hypothetical protein
MTLPSIHAFAEKVAVVTGVDSPVGRAIAIQLALNGAFVTTISALEQGERSVRGLLELGTLANHIRVDPTTQEGAQAVWADVNGRFGRLDLLVDVRSSVSETDSGDSANTIDEPISSLMALMSDRPSPRLVRVLTGDSSGEALVRSFRSEVSQFCSLLPLGFRINGLIVGSSESRRDDSELLASRIGVDADDAARVAIFFLSGESKAVNGQILTL